MSGTGEQAPKGEARVMGAEVDAHVRRGEVGAFADPAADLDDAEAQGVELEAWGPGREEPASELIEQPEGRGMEEESERVGPETMVAEASSGEGILEVFDPIL